MRRYACCAFVQRAQVRAAGTAEAIKRREGALVHASRVRRAMVVLMMLATCESA